MDILVTYCERWDTPLRTSKHHYIERLAADGHRILYVEVPANPLSVLRRMHEFKSQIMPRIREGAESVADNIWALTGFVPLPYHPVFGGLFDRLWVNQLNQQLLLPRLKAAQTCLGFHSPILLSYYPFILPIIKKLRISRTVFHIVDEWQGLAGIPRSMAELTKQMLKYADVTIVASSRLFNRYKPYAKRIELLRHGTDLSTFEPVAKGQVAPDPKVRALPGKKVGYYGALHKLDNQLIAKVAKARPEWTFLFVGPIAGAQGIRKYYNFPANVHIWEVQPRATLPALLAGIDAFWMPFSVNELTHSMCPIKIYEVLSAGLPIVSSDLQECRAVAGRLGLFAYDVQTHLTQMEKAFSLRDALHTESRVEAMRNYDWSKRYNDFLRFLRCKS